MTLCRLILILLFTLSPLAACGRSGPEPFPPPISLMDQLDPAEPLGPWRLAAEVRGLEAWVEGATGFSVPIRGELIEAHRISSLPDGQKKLAHRVMGRKGAFVQTAPVSSWRTLLAVGADERLLCGLTYGLPWVETPRVEVRLLRDGHVVAGVEAMVDGHRGEARLTVPAGGADSLEIRHHLALGARLPLRRATLLVVERSAGEDAVARAGLFLRMASGPLPFPVARISERRVFPLALDGRTFDTMLLSSGEERVLEVPSGLDGRRLRSWVTVLDGGTGEEPAVSLEADAGGRWQPVARLPLGADDVGTWKEIGAGERLVLPEGCRAVRLSLIGREAIIGISGPILLSAEQSPGRKNLLVVDLDTLRADRLESYGYTERPTSSRLDRVLAQQGGHLFENACTSAAFTLPATAKLLAGRYHDIQHDQAIPRDYTLLPEMLRDAGYHCAAFTGGGKLRHPGFEQGFHEYHWSLDRGKVGDSFPQTAAWLEEHGGDPFFLFLHTYEPHEPYTRGTFCAGLPNGRLGNVAAGEPLIPPGGKIRNDTSLTPDEQRYVNAVYDGGVRKSTDAVADLLGTLERLGLADSTVVVILSDHGEEFWEHTGHFAKHGQSLYGELLNVPLIILDPERPAAGLHRITETVSTVDLVPTVLELLDLPLTVPVDGVSLVPLMEGDPGIQREVPVLACRLDLSFCVVADGMKLIQPLGPRPWEATDADLPPQPAELYRLADDPGERRNLVEAEPELARRMTALLHRAAAEALPPIEVDPVGPAPLDPDLQRQLRALGYADVK